MLERIEDRNLTGIRQLMAPRAMKARIPQSVKAAETVVGARNAIRDLIHGRDTRRLAVIVGPCSIHDPEAAVAYARRLRRASEPLQGELVVAEGEEGEEAYIITQGRCRVFKRIDGGRIKRIY